MTKIDPVPAPAAGSRQPGVWPVTAIILGTVFLSGVVGGYFDAMRDDGKVVPSLALVSGLVFLAGLTALTLYLARFGRFWQTWSRRKQLYILSLLLAALLGVAISILLHVGGGSTVGLMGSGAIDPRFAWAAALAWTFGMGGVILLYHRNIDDHEKHAYLWGGLAGFYAVVFTAPTWWLLARAAVAPPIDAMGLFFAAIVANAVVYLWLKFR